MENNIMTFTNDDFGEVRTLIIDNEPWFVGKDVAIALGYSEPRSAVSKKVSCEDRGVAKMETPSGVQEMTTINESGLYSLIFGSKLETAKKFKHWVTSEVLPSIRKHGAYMTEQTIEKALTSPDFLIELATKLKEEQEARKLAETKLKEQEPLVEFANKVSESSNLIGIGKMAKVLHDEKIDIGRNKLFQWLRDNDVLMKDNIPYQRFINEGYFQVKESVYKTPYGTKTQLTTYVTGKGQIYITERLRKEYKGVA